MFKEMFESQIMRLLNDEYNIIPLGKTEFQFLKKDNVFIDFYIKGKFINVDLDTKFYKIIGFISESGIRITAINLIK